MKYTPDEALSQILRRSERIALRRKRRSCQRLTGICSALLAVLVLGITVMPEKLAVTSAGSVYGSFLLSREAGGYVLIALIAFVLGVTVTLLCQKGRKKHDGMRNGQSPDRLRTFAQNDTEKCKLEKE